MKGQISVEFLVVIAISLTLLVMFMPVFNNIFHKVVFSLDIMQTSKVVNQVENDISLLNSLSDGSFKKVEYSPYNDANFSCGGKKLNVNLYSDLHDKNFSEDLPIECHGNIDINTNKMIKMHKVGGEIYIE